MRPYWLSLLLFLAMFVIAAPLGGCEFKCSTDADNSLEESIDEVGDEVEDVIDKAKKDNE